MSDTPEGDWKDYKRLRYARMLAGEELEEQLRCRSNKIDQFEELTNALQELKPLLNGDSGTYLGTYEDAAKKICSIMGWK
jgi:uncharacterized protein YceH (UPF0502 family)